MNWKKNEGSVALHKLLTQTQRDASKIRSIGAFLASDKQIKILFDSIDLHHHHSISQQDLIIYYIETNIKLRPKELQILKQHFGLIQKSRVDFREFLNLLKSGGAKLLIENSYHPEGRDLEQVFEQYLNMILFYRQNCAKLVENVRCHQNQLNSYFRANLYEVNEREWFSLELVKDFMYDSGCYSRANFLLIKQELFKHGNSLDLQPKVLLLRQDSKKEASPKQGKLYSKRNQQSRVIQQSGIQTKQKSIIKSVEIQYSNKPQHVGQNRDNRSKESVNKRSIRPVQFSRQRQQSRQSLQNHLNNNNSRGHQVESTRLNKITGTSKDGLNVNSVLDQIENIEKALEEKRSRNNERRKVFEDDQASRCKIVGQILSKKSIDEPENNRTYSKIQTQSQCFEESRFQLPETHCQQTQNRNNTTNISISNFEAEGRSSTKKKSKFHKKCQHSRMEEQKFNNEISQQQLINQNLSQRDAALNNRMSFQKQDEQSKLKKRQQLLQKASSEAKMKIQEIERKALEKVYSKPKINNSASVGMIGKRTQDFKEFKILERKMEDSADRYRYKDRFDSGYKGAYSYSKGMGRENLRLF